MVVICADLASALYEKGATTNLKAKSGNIPAYALGVLPPVRRNEFAQLTAVLKLCTKSECHDMAWLKLFAVSIK